MKTFLIREPLELIVGNLTMNEPGVLIYLLSRESKLHFVFLSSIERDANFTKANWISAGRNTSYMD